MDEMQKREWEEFQNYKKNKGKNKKRWLWGCGGFLGIFIILAIIFGACSMMFSNVDFESTGNNTNTTSKKSNDVDENNNDSNDDLSDSNNDNESNSSNNDNNDNESNSSNNDNNDDGVSREFKNALKSAQDYQEVMPMSKAGLYDQLTSSAGDQYPEDAAQYAIDNLEADYKENALKSAESYQEIMPMSDKELFDQLTSDAGDKYTQEEAQYAIDNIENHISDEDSDDEDTDDEYDIVTRSNVMDIVEDYEGSTLDTDTYTYREPEKRDDGSWGFAFYTKDGELAGSYIVDEDGIVTKYDEDGVEE
ncbi:Ltp family lipoprotein [Mammaliicoccus sciuri]|uniref:Ltp family lipoprotein n=1 Tax=Mammaliicoccus sciuri TaxID=1296 RepID=UPI0008076FCF|nr:Ltp family lipoprotein [Mammaliicoccus sciuri]MCJ0955083.1 Ltp family lipoprotein [Mammaliicoccus sciuri]MCP1286207.1 Ltp family lipoprotein [Mammaliicoccus sciuri]MDU0266431.1 Ltp family lipoprotein [Mammaliicoccus sciuri]MEB5676540.1 Ltp family lipoprotein [Mammaliicoccus sciuri]MEB6121627.1 Ltp family lipoprotein [Mammaliicoccus sciuri]